MGASKELLALQKAQLTHDETAHRDILCLPIQTRIRHMVLHFAKYTGHFIDARERGQVDLLKSTIVDTWIIVLASSNMLNLRLGRELRVEHFEHKDIHALGQALATSVFASCADPYDLALFQLGRITGSMAKACESLDHMERFDSRATLEQGVIEAARVSLAVSAHLGLDLHRLVCERWKQVEEKSIFYDKRENLHAHQSLPVAPSRKLG